MTVTDRVVHIIGDGADGNWLTWRWADGRRGVHRVGELAAPLAEFRDALPTLGNVGFEDPTVPERERLARKLRRLGLYGTLTKPKEEHQLMQRLAGALLPQALQDQLVAAAGDGLVQVRVMPSPPTAAVPWGLLPVAKDRRLLEIADVSWIAPILPRDVDAEAAPVTPATGDALHVCNPHSGPAVIAADWQRCGCNGNSHRLDGAKRPADLQAALAQGYARLMVVGHCSSRGAGDTGIEFARGSLLASHLIRQPSQWPMPPRVGVVACASGTDLVQSEPFGLATGLLICGAELAQLTLWVLPTDAALGQVEQAAHGQFAALAQAMDHAQGSADPVREVNAYQRNRLAAWRSSPSLATSPLVWGAAFVTTAPHERRIASG